MRLRLACCVILLGAVARGGAAATWSLSAGPTIDDGAAFELSRRSPRWEIALGYIGEQQVSVRYMTPVCPYEGAPPDACATDVQRGRESVQPYAYLSIQRRFELVRDSPLRPVFGLGLVGQSDTNPYVSSPVNFSLSLGLAVGRRASIEWRHFSNGGLEEPNLGQDTILLRWTLQ